MSLLVLHHNAICRETIEKQADQLISLEDKFAELEAELKANRGDIDSNTAAVEKLEQVESNSGSK